MQTNDFVRTMRNPGGNRRTRRSINSDAVLLLVIFCLCCFGLAILYSAGDQNLSYVKRQSIFMLVGFLLMLLIAQLPVRILHRWAFLLYGLGLLSLLAVLLFGVGAKGAQRWLDLGFTRIQPAELMKVLVPMMVSSYLGSRYIPPNIKHVFWSLVMVLLPTLLIIRQPDLGTAILIFLSGFLVIFLAGLGKRYVFGSILIALAAIPLMWLFVLRDYQKQRILTMLSPEDDTLGAGWNIVQSKTAIGSGGVNGKGWLEGTQSQLNFLPESHTDFIIAVLAEEFGLIGILTLCTLYACVIARCLFIAINAQTQFGRLLAGSLGLIFFIYIFVNMGMVSGILPVVGAPLPMISYGGTAILTLFIGFGMLMAISAEPKLIRTQF
jgi:rod shape determining protein RodA